MQTVTTPSSNPEPSFKIPAPKITNNGFVGATKPATAIMIRPMIGNVQAIANIFSLPNFFTILGNTTSPPISAKIHTLKIENNPSFPATYLK